MEPDYIKLRVEVALNGQWRLLGCATTRRVRTIVPTPTDGAVLARVVARTVHHVDVVICSIVDPRWISLYFRVIIGRVIAEVVI